MTGCFLLVGAMLGGIIYFPIRRLTPVNGNRIASLGYIKLNKISPTTFPAVHFSAAIGVRWKLNEGETFGIKVVKIDKKVSLKRLTKPIDVARALAFLCSEESGLMTVSLIDCDHTVNGWHLCSAYDASILNDSLLGLD